MKTRPISYRMKTLKNLLECYAHETDRANREDAETTQRYIVNEVYARVMTAFALLDEGADIEKVYKQLIEN